MDKKLWGYWTAITSSIGGIATLIAYKCGLFTQKKEEPKPETFGPLYDWINSPDSKKTYIGNNKEQIINQLNSTFTDVKKTPYKTVFYNNVDHMSKDLNLDAAKIKQSVNKITPQNPNSKESQEAADFINKWCEIKIKDKKTQKPDNWKEDAIHLKGDRNKDDWGVFNESCTKPKK
ncbi:hypothetical protein MHSWG343_01760 [Candidatus Mycoplasma haematohominis]|uniref:Uncharacterized protein n=1 Tax=Candidatus Mycoplasma haematohominis TaxID=1494318 RepID=A0A478FPA4_9MOLU|nr:hypothetical protein MHSWG343_01760 [Candidatus Mycoplasma haemohominis]